MMANQCVVCGGEMPEGDQVCKLCRAKPFAARGGLAFQRTARQNIDDRIIALVEEIDALECELEELLMLRDRMAGDMGAEVLK
ncbi:MAG: hypothetical protein GX540_04315 [Clostridiales bacterium]|nr:hypothetical protein [Clostridiales bacterium]